MNWFMIRPTILTALLLLNTSGFVFPQQSCSKASLRASHASIGANYHVEFSDIRVVRGIFGNVTTNSNDAIPNAILDVFPVTRLSKKGSSVEATESIEPLSSYNVDANGLFCLADLPNGDYILRVGTEKFAFAHSFIKVRKTPSGSRKSINIELAPGN
jgi:hypothetical protein